MGYVSSGQSYSSSADESQVVQVSHVYEKAAQDEKTMLCPFTPAPEMSGVQLPLLRRQTLVTGIDGEAYTIACNICSANTLVDCDFNVSMNLASLQQHYQTEHEIELLNAAHTMQVCAKEFIPAASLERIENQEQAVMVDIQPKTEVRVLDERAQSFHDLDFA